MSNEVKNRIEYNMKENERYFNELLDGAPVAARIAFQQRLTAAVFSVIEADDFKKLCLKIVRDLGGVTRH